MTDDPVLPAAKLQKVVPVCAIGASAGGIAALQTLFRNLPADLGLAYVIILHLSPDHPSALSDILSSCTRMSVLQVDDGPTLKADCVYVIPPDRELMIQDDHVVTRPFEEPRGRRAPIDMFFRSIAAARGDGIAVVLSGAGADGAVGVRAVKEAGGVVMVQDPAEAGFASMPQNAIAAGVADFIAPLARLAERIVEVAHSKEAVRSLDMDGNANDLRRITAFLRARTGHDFASYKRATVMRRVVRRMQVCRTDTLAAYADYLAATPEETKELLSDLLISVTMFFRDPLAFEGLAEKAIKPLFDDLDPDTEDGLRMWTVGCATGEEAYSIAILVHEEAARRKLYPHVQIFASDLDEGSLATAREGRYPRSIEADVSQERLARFFVDEGTHYRVRKEVRESVLFSKHSVIKDPPFMRLDLITCRNLLIYLERTMQQQLHSIFHYCLKPGRYLFLGSAETADAAAELFAPLDRDARLYCARPQAAQMLPVIPFATPERLVTPVALPARIEDSNRSAALHVSALEQSAPPTALVDDMHNILHLSPSAGRFILHSVGPISNTLPAIVRPELRLDLRLALVRAIDQKQPTLTHPTIVAFDGERRRVAMQVTRLPGEAHMGAQALVFFLDGGAASDAEPIEIRPDTGPDEARRLHAELRLSQEALLASRHGHEVAVQDLRASNEELQSINEEYRSTAEELETSKEELQSINEELHTVNAELKSKLASISVAHSDLQNLTAATDIGALFLDTDLRIKMFTPPVAELFNITRADVGRAITHFRHNLNYETLENDAKQVMRNLTPSEREIQSRSDRWYVVRLRPYRTIEDRIDGTVVTFIDITERRLTEASLRGSEARFRTLAETAPALIWRNDAEGANQFINQYFIDYTGKSANKITGEGWQALVHPEDVDAYVADFLEAVRERRAWSHRNRIRRHDGAWRWFDNYAQPLFDEQKRYLGHVGVSTDIDVNVRAEQALRDSEQKFHALFAASPAPFLVIKPDAPRFTIAEVNDAYLAATMRTREELVGHGIFEAYPDNPDNASVGGVTTLRASLERVLASRQPDALPSLKYDIARPDGTFEERWWHPVNSPVLNDNGEVEAIIHNANDVTEAYRSEAALRQSEELRRIALESGGMGAWRWDTRNRSFQADETVQKLWGVLPPGQPQQVSTYTDLMLPEGAAWLENIAAKEISPGEDIHGQVQIASGANSGRWVQLRGRADRDRPWMINGISFDITEQKQAEATLRESEERYRELFESIDEGFCIIDMIFDGHTPVDYRFLDVNPAFEHQTGIVGAKGRLMREIAPEHEQLWFDFYGAVAATGQARRFQAQARALGDRWYDSNAFRVGEPEQRRVAIVFSDITRRQRDAAALRESEERFAQFAASSSDALWVRDATTLMMEYTSPAIQPIYGIGPDAIIGPIERWTALIVEEDRDIAREHLEKARGGEAVTHEFRIRRPSDDKQRWIKNTDFPLRDEHGRVQRIGGLAEDVTEARELRERQGVLIAELQHRTRNLMGVVRSMADKTMRRSIDLADFQTRYSARLAALTRAQSLLSRLAEGERITFDELIQNEMAAMNGEADRVTLDGPKGVALRSSTVQTFSLALHELATNAGKYGAFAQPGARLEIRWRVERLEKDGRPWLHLDWREHGVAMPAQEELPQGSGSGRELIERALPYQLGAKTTFVMGADGVHCTIALPVSERQSSRKSANA